MQIRQMTATDLPALERLRAAAGFNQTMADWKRFITHEPTGCFVGVVATRVVASSVAITYGNGSGWIGMVIVDPDERARGHGRALAARAVDYLDRVGCRHIGLDATPAGYAIYRRLGFVAVGTISRWEHSAAAAPASRPIDAPVGARRLQNHHLSAVLDLDARALGVDRSAMLRAIVRSRDCDAIVLERAGRIAGFRLCRLGAALLAVGPVVLTGGVCKDDELRLALTNRGPTGVAVNLFDDINQARALESLGFTRVRGFKRMYRNGWPAADPSVRYLAALGPELG